MALADLFPVLFDNYFIKLIFLVHATVVSLACIAIQSNGDTIAYGIYNIIFLITILLAILVDKSTDIALVASGFNVICIILDILLLISGGYFGLVAILLVVFNLICRPLSTVLLLRNYSARAGVEDPTNGLLEVHVPSSQPRSTYHNIDEPSQTLP